jgi:SAM-dependent methyltransferase
VLGALTEAGREIDPLDPDDLAGIDEFHGLGRAATLAMADVAGVGEGARVLDVGAGIGGPARTLARYRGARVTAVDPTRRFCDLNEELTRRSGLAANVTVVCADGRSLPFGDGEFELAWTQAVWPSIEDKAGLLAELQRVLEPGGQLCIYEVVKGPSGGELIYPVPWADGPEESFMVSSDDVRRLAQDAGFTVGEWLEGQQAVERIGAAARAPGMTQGVEGVTLALVMPDFDERMAGLGQNVAAGKIALVMALLERI